MKNHNMSVRAFWRATKVESAQPPYDTIHLKVFYPAQVSESELEPTQDIIPADSEQAPFPVAIFFSGFNCGMEMYRWLAVKLVERGLVVVTFSWIEEFPPGRISLTPGLNLSMWQPDTYGTEPTTSTLPSLLAELDHLHSEEPLADMLDLQRIVLGGHSAGGRMAVENADPRFFPQVAAAFAYGTSAAAPVMLGHEPGKILPLPDARPLLLMGGTRDGAMALIGDRFGFKGDATTPIRRTFAEAIAGGRGDSYLVILEGANHFSLADPFDTTTSSSFLDLPATQPEGEIRSLMAEIIGLFIDAHVRHQPAALEAFNQLLDAANPSIASFERK